MGYFTKWGDGAYDFNPIGDLTVTEVYEFLRFLGAPASILEKAPSAGLFDGQTDEGKWVYPIRALTPFWLVLPSAVLNSLLSKSTTRQLSTNDVCRWSMEGEHEDQQGFP